MIVEPYKPYIENMLRAEPWRGDAGPAGLCDGHITWDGTRFWLCTACGRIGTSYTQLHNRAVSPEQLLSDSLNEITRKWSEVYAK